MSALDRLAQLRRENLAVAVSMQQHAPRIEAIKQQRIDGPQIITGFNLFQTPEPIAERMAEIIKPVIKPGARILEPSAGLGRLITPLEDMRPDWLLVEENSECCRAIRQMIGKEIARADFLQYQITEPVDAVIMNPPFKQGRDIKHIEHALSMVKPGGRLVSLCYNGVKQNKQLKPIADHWEVLPGNSFKESGTGADVALLIINK